MELIAPGWEDYELIDSGGELRLERFGDVTVSRQSGQAIWEAHLSKEDWDAQTWSTHYRQDQGPGEWKHRRKIPDSWQIRFGRAVMELKLTPFGHTGLFAEQQAQWPWITSELEGMDGPRVLNLFAYTGGSTLAAALGGARVTHVDAVKNIVNWARKNAELSGLADAPIRWIVDDALKYCRRELRRGSQYEAIVLDPPTFGRGPQGSIWKIEDQLTELLEVLVQLLSDQARFLLLSAHTPGMTAAVLNNLLHGLVKRRGGRLESGDMVQTSTHSPFGLPSGVYCRWTSE